MSPTTENRIGAAYSLCPQYVTHLPDILRLRNREPIERVLECFGSAPLTVVNELGYFDLDYRSEFTATHETSFQARSVNTQRLHFFAGAPADEDRPSLLHDTVAELRDEYLGYVILRPQTPGTVGRSLIPTRLATPGGGNHAKTVVREYVEVFATTLAAEGVPFMEQDRALMRCAHVSTWICHFTAVLKGQVARRPSAAFHRAERGAHHGASFGRTFPSDGLAGQVISELAEQLDLPAEIVDSMSLAADRPLQWSDRLAFRTKVADLETAIRNAEDEHRYQELATAKADLHRTWIAENLTSTLSRYLNSGIPVIVSRNNEFHTQVAVGYLRQEDLDPAGPKPARALHSDVVRLLINDDERGPLIEVPITDVVEEVFAARDDPIASIIVPLPRGLWMTSATAEKAGTALLGGVAAKLLADQAVRTAGNTTLRDFRDQTPIEGLHASKANSFTVRTYASTGSDFKLSFAHRFPDPAAVRLVGYQRLPKYVWVIEAVDRQARANNRDAVIATAVLDGSQVITRPQDLSAISPLFVHVPGLIYARTLADVGLPLTADRNWTDVPARLYDTGRWANHTNDLLEPDRVATRFKGTTTGN